jgi:RNA polymerase sigma-70 factor, ECF subfamily
MKSSPEPCVDVWKGKPSVLDDAQYILRARAGDHEAFKELMNAHRDAVYRAVYHVLRNEEESLDVVQESFLKAYQALKGFEGKASFRTWVRRIAVNRSLNRLRDTKKHRSVAALPEGDFVADSKSTTPLQNLERRELKELVRREIDALGSNHAVALRLHDIEGLSYGEIAEITGVKAGTVMSRIHYARQKLKERLSIHMQEMKKGRVQ